MEKVLKRDSNFELLRIVSMFFIVLHHLVYHGGYNGSNVLDLNGFILTFFKSGGKLGVALFTMITGYYMIKSKDIKIKKIIGLEFQVLFYSLGIFLLFNIFWNIPFSMIDFFKSLFPNIFKTYWFFSSYLILYLCIPFLNRLIGNVNKKEYERLLIIGFIFLILIPSIVIYNKSITEGIYLFYYYLIGGYISLYLKDLKGRLKYLLGFILSYLGVVVMTMIISKLSFVNVILVSYLDSFYKLSSLLIFISSICLFLYFKNLKIKNSKFINLIASCMFGVYLFHEHIYMRAFLWQYIFTLDKLTSGGFIFFKGILYASFVFIISIVIEMIRQVIFKYFTKLKRKSIKFN